MKNSRIALAQLMLRSGSMIKSLAMMVMRPDDLIEFGRMSYIRQDTISRWSDPSFLQDGLNSFEQYLLERCPIRSGKLLLLGVGGGREAIALAQRSYRVTGVDFVAGMVDQAKNNAARLGYSVDGLVQEITALDIPAASFDMCWLSSYMYSSIPTRYRRVAMLRLIARGLRDDGIFICQFHWNPRLLLSARSTRLHHLVAALTRGYRQFEPGDRLWAHQEFLHVFLDESSLREEFIAGGFNIIQMVTNENDVMGGAVLQKRNDI
ncbi:MAG: class I SAM-dependent methyltransferase [Desulfofustis sp.]|nr:class I SAM-dependent methyltransferase [Desulfofustis sp.]